MITITNWKPSLRNITVAERPDWVPVPIYQEALAAKRHYNAAWDWWVYEVSRTHNVPMAEAEEACVRGVKKEIAKTKFIYGDKIGTWFEEFLDMSSIFNKTQHPDYYNELGYRAGGYELCLNQQK